MAITYGIYYPFRVSDKGDFLRMTKTPQEEVRSNLIHLLLTRKGTRYYLPDFGTRIYEFIFEQNDNITFDLLEEDIRESIKRYIPNLDINSIDIQSAENIDDVTNNVIDEDDDARLFRVADPSTKPYTAKIRIDYSVNDGTFNSSDFIIINI